MFAAAIFGVCACFCCLRWCRTKCRRPIEGSTYLVSPHTWASWSVERPQDAAEVDPDDCKDNKTHVIWDLSARTVRTIVQGHRTKEELLITEAAPQGDVPPGGGSAEAEQKKEEQSEEAVSDYAREHSQEHHDVVLEVSGLAGLAAANTTSEWRSIVADDFDDFNLAELFNEIDEEHTHAPSYPDKHPAYTDRERVEYFSWTHLRWFTAKLDVTTEGNAHCEQIVYNAIVRAGTNAQQRPNIELNVLRKPLSEGEEVEVYMKKRGKWLPAVIHGEQKNLAASGPGYRIKVQEEDEPVINNVAANRLRRRFREGTVVKVYRGASHGWVLALVDGPPTEGCQGGDDPGLSADLSGPVTTMPQELCSPRALSPGQRSPPYSPRLQSPRLHGVSRPAPPCPRPGQPTPAVAEVEVEDPDITPSLWQLVPVRGLDGASCIFHTMVVPSYLLLPASIPG